MRRLNPFGLMAALENEADTVTPDTPAKTDTPADDTTKPDDAAAAAAAAADTTTTAATTDDTSTTASTADTTTTDVEPTPADDIGDNAESLETDLIDVAEDQGEAAADEATLDEAVETVDTLEEVDEALADAIEAGGLTKEGADVVATAIECLFDRVGYRIPGERLVALEKFTGTSTALEALEDTRKKVAEGAKKIWDSIIAAIKKSIAWLQERFTLLFQGADKMKARAASLAEKAESFAGKKPAAEEFENARLYSALHIGGKVEPKNADVLKSAATTALHPKKDLIGELTSALKGGYEKFTGNAIIEAAVSALGKGEEVNSTNAQGIQLPEGFIVHRGEELPGAKAVVLTIADREHGDESSFFQRMPQSTLALVEGWPIRKDVSRPLATLSAEGVKQISSDVGGVADAVLNFKAEMGKLVGEKNALVREIEALKKKGDDNSAKLAKIGLLVSRLIDNPCAGFTAYALNTGKAFLDYSEESLKQYQGKPAAKEEKKEEAAAA